MLRNSFSYRYRIQKNTLKRNCCYCRSNALLPFTVPFTVFAVEHSIINFTHARNMSMLKFTLPSILSRNTWDYHIFCASQSNVQRAIYWLCTFLRDSQQNKPLLYYILVYFLALICCWSVMMQWPWPWLINYDINATSTHIYHCRMIWISWIFHCRESISFTTRCLHFLYHMKLSFSNLS